MEWIQGRRLTPGDVDDPEVREFLVTYLASQTELAQSRDDWSSEEQKLGIKRLVEMVRCNLREVLGEDAAANACKAFSRSLKDLPLFGPYRDGRMGPWEFVRDGFGRIWKTDAHGHEADHTVVGRQPWLWDLAGLAVEWQLTDERRARLLSSLNQLGHEVESDWLKGFEIAYVAFRLGQIQIGMSLEQPSERSRLEELNSAYLQRLIHCLESRETGQCRPEGRGVFATS